MLRLTHPLWQAAYRPLFFCAGLWALLAPAVWLWPGGYGGDPVGWHLYELVFGMGGAAVGGYLLTALPSWTGGGPVPPRRVRALAILWVLARLAWPLVGVVPVWLVLGLALGYFVFLAAILAAAIIRARAWSRLIFPIVVAVLAMADAALLARHAGGLAIGPGTIAPVLIFAFLHNIIGGRAVPAFSESWRYKSGGAGRINTPRALVAAPAALIATAAGLMLAGRDDLAGWLLPVAAGLQALNMTGWQVLRAEPYPALRMLQAAWLWSPVGLLLLGGALLRPQMIQPATAVHALTMGAMGTMILAISARAAMRRHGAKLLAGPGLSVAFVLVWLSPLVRLLHPYVAFSGFDPVIVSAAIWMAGWATFLWAFRPALRGAVPSPVLSARLAPQRGRPRK